MNPWPKKRFSQRRPEAHENRDRGNQPRSSKSGAHGAARARLSCAHDADPRDIVPGETSRDLRFRIISVLIRGRNLSVCQAERRARSLARRLGDSLNNASIREAIIPILIKFDLRIVYPAAVRSALHQTPPM